MANRSNERMRLWPLLVWIVVIAIISTGALVVTQYIAATMRVQRITDDLRKAGAALTAAASEPPDVPNDQNAFVLYDRAARMLV